MNNRMNNENQALYAYVLKCLEYLNPIKGVRVHIRTNILRNKVLDYCLLKMSIVISTYHQLKI